MTNPQRYLDRRWTALILLCVAQLIVVLDASIVNVALPSMGAVSISPSRTSRGSSTRT